MSHSSPVRIRIIGNTSTGKSTLASSLSSIYSIPHLELDSLRFTHNWKSRSDTDFIHDVQTYVQTHDSWIIDGNYRVLGEKLLKPTLIIYLRYSFIITLWRLIIRTISRVWSGHDQWGIPGCRETITHVFSCDGLFIWLFTVYRRNQHVLLERVMTSGVDYHIFTSPKQTEEWLQRQRQRYQQQQQYRSEHTKQDSMSRLPTHFMSSISHTITSSADRVFVSKMLSNILHAPQEPKYRRVRWSTVESKLEQPSSTRSYLTHIGFTSVTEDDKEYLILPTSASITSIEHAYTSLNDQDMKTTEKDEKEQILAETHDMVETSEFVFFWRPPGWPGQWTYSPFCVDGQEYHCAEQYMMAEKARLFNDESTRRLILECTDPRQHKKLGRLVQNFDDTVWKRSCVSIVERGNYAKFTQNLQLKKALLATGEKMLVEASPLDKLWGIGLTASDARKLKPGQWKGQNLLGKALMNVRTRIRKEES